MFHPTVKGTYYEIGHTYGASLYKHGFRVPEQSPEKLDFGRKSEKEVERVFPEILREVHGFAGACHASYENLLGLLLGVGTFKVEPKCSVFAASHGSDILFGRNYDFCYSFKKYTEGYLTCPEDGYWSIGHSDIFVGREDGVNEKGLAIAMTGIREKVVEPGINFPIATRYVLDKCADVEEGLKFLSHASFSTTSNYLLADKEGNMVVVEASPNLIRVRKPENRENFIVCTNHFLHPEMQESEDVKLRPTDSIERYTTRSNNITERWT